MERAVQGEGPPGPPGSPTLQPCLWSFPQSDKRGVKGKSTGKDQHCTQCGQTRFPLDFLFELKQLFPPPRTSPGRISKGRGGGAAKRSHSLGQVMGDLGPFAHSSASCWAFQSRRL